MDYIFTIVYFLFCICIIYPPTEFITAGITVQCLFSSLLGDEHERFVTYHMKKSCLNLFIYSLLPLCYIMFSCFFQTAEEFISLFETESSFWRIFASSSLILPLLAAYQILQWTRNNFELHPIALNVSKFCNNNMDWRAVANSIDIEFRNINKVCLQTSTIVKIVATENWLLKISPINMFVIHQSDASLVVKEANTYQLSPQNTYQAQYLNIEVKSSRQGVDPFVIRINADDFKNLKDRVARSITILPNVKFHKSVVEQFIDVFKDTIKNNPTYETNQELDQCVGCLQSLPSVKLQKLCEDVPGQTNCTACYCKPMWCVDCMAKWFASRQDNDQQHKWLACKCTCPMCRATFCLLDVCPLELEDGTEE